MHHVLVLSSMHTSVMQRPIHLSMEGHEFPWLVGGSSWSSHLCALLPFNGPPLSVESREFPQLAGDSTGTAGMMTVRLMMSVGCGCTAGCGDCFAGRLRPVSRGDVRVPEEVAASPPVLPFGGTGGFAVGAATGSAIGMATGSAVGVATGSAVGVATGSAVGVATGSAVGVATGSLMLI